MKNDDEILEGLIAGGVIGTALEALLSKNNNVTGLGALIGAAILATYKAGEKARQTNVPVYVETNGNLYLVDKDGNKKFIRKIEKSAVKLKSNFKLT
jgi:malate/lactate dehydrogenase